MDSVSSCRACGSKSLTSVVDLGVQSLSGVFPKSKGDIVPQYPLGLVCCETCKLVQLSVNCPPEEMYGVGYGYRSSATIAMRRHLGDLATYANTFLGCSEDAVIVDIGCNDGYLLEQFSTSKCFGFDPVGIELEGREDFNFNYISDFFSAERFLQISDSRANLVTSISMFYDLENPIEFASQIYDILCDDGVWIVEISYLADVIENLVYDSICHEHLSYYSLSSLEFIFNSAKFKIIDVSQNDLNGGSLRVALAKENSNRASMYNKGLNKKLDILAAKETALGLHDASCFKDFNLRLNSHKNDILRFFDETAKNKTVVGYGASTKGNVLLQYCGIDEKTLPVIGDISPHKKGCFTPGTQIPIVPMEEAIRLRADFYFVLPWSFKEFILSNEQSNREKLQKSEFVFPLPSLHRVNFASRG
jgi:hypothetical protein